ncbi:hypothetical protein LguiA_024608 [Lonicera macranthoides]
MLGGQGRSLANSPFVFFLFLEFLLFPVFSSQISLGSKLSVEEKNFWVSSNGDFAVGFFNRSNQYSLGIRFNSRSIPTHKQMVVWVAGADLTVGGESYFQLTQNGELIVFDSTRGSVAWTSNTTNSAVASAVLGDDGNLFLLSRNKGIVWQSFDTPSDTLLPGQNLSGSQSLRAASRNSLSSYYSLHVLDQLQLKWESNVIYWSSGSPQSILRTILGSDGTLQLLDQRSKSVWSVFGEDHSDPDVKFRFLRLDVDGNLRLYSWVQASSLWRSVWQAVENQCNVFDTCGLSGICVFNASGSPVCKCPFMPTSESNSKCLVPYRQDCRSGSSMDTLEHTSLYAVYPLNETITQTSLKQCKSLCQQDPLCFASTFTNDGTAQCRMKKTQYISGHMDPSLSNISFVKRCLDPIAVFPVPNTTQSPLQNTLPKRAQKFCITCLIGVAGGAFILFVLIQFGIGFWIYKRRKSLGLKASSAFVGSNPNSFLVLSYTEIKDLTENFKHQIGPKMFKGILENERPVAVKELNATIEERKFRCAVLKIGSISHKSLVKLEGYCCEPGHRILVYEFAKNGSIAECLEDPKMRKRLTWRKRMEICLTVARAISYLHNDCREFVSHGNLKCENVVLDEKMEAKVSEFGLCSVLGDTSAEWDILDFGKMVLKLVTGHNNDGDVEWVYEKWSEGEAKRVADERIEDTLDLDSFERVLRIAFWCLQNDERMRPSMGEVLKVLEGTLAVDPPPPPFSRRPLEEEEPEPSGSGSE